MQVAQLLGEFGLMLGCSWNIAFFSALEFPGHSLVLGMTGAVSTTTVLVECFSLSMLSLMNSS